MDRLFAFLLFFICTQFLSSQNLIPNAGFESYSLCPDNIKQLNRAESWYSANAGTPEYFNTCGFMEEINPHEGEAMVGLIFLDDYRSMVEYIQVQLLNPLVKGEKYQLEFFVASSPLNPIVTNKIGAFFSREELKTPLWEPFIRKPQIELEEVIDENGKWTKVSGTFVARGGEKYMAIGNFYEVYYLKEERTFKNTKQVYTYYYFDSFKLTSANYKEYKEEVDLKLKQKLVFSHMVYFDSDKYSINDSEKIKLDAFLREIKEEKTLQIRLEAHTDTVGTDSYNLLLSQERANSVAQFIDSLINLPSYSIWFGENQPLVKTDMDTNKSNALNRRVKITAIQ